MQRVLLIIGGGIAAYKAPELVRQLRAQGLGVRCLMTAAAAQFVSPLSLASVESIPVGLFLGAVDLPGVCPRDLVSQHLAVGGVAGALDLDLGVPEPRAEQRWLGHRNGV